MATPTARREPQVHIPRRRARALAVVATALGALAVWLVTDPLLGIDLKTPTGPGSQQLQHLTPALVAATSLVVALAGWGLLALLERFTVRARTIWTAIAVLVALLSLVGPLSSIARSTAANGLALALMHLAVGAVLIPVLAGTSPSPPGQHERATQQVAEHTRSAPTMNERNPPMTQRVLAVGKSRRVLSKLTRALTEAGFGAQWTTDIATASQRFPPPSVDLVAFGRGVGSADRSRLRSDFRQGNPAVLFADGLAPITPLLVAQVQAAFSSQPLQARVLEHLASSDGQLTIAVRDDCDVEVTVYRLDRLYRTHTATPLAQRIITGSHAIPLGPQATGRGLRFAVVRINTTEVSIVNL